jgi:hypothetical protein
MKKLGYGSSDAEQWANVLELRDATLDRPAGWSPDEYNHYETADALVHESCHVEQMHDLIPWFLMSKNAKEKACHTAALDALKQIDATQDLIDWNQDIIDSYS